MGRIDPNSYTEIQLKTFYKVYANARRRGKELRPLIQVTAEITKEQYDAWRGAVGTDREADILKSLQTVLRKAVAAPPNKATWNIASVMFEGMTASRGMPKDNEVGEWEGHVFGKIGGREVAFKGVQRDASDKLIIDDSKLLTRRV